MYTYPWSLFTLTKTKTPWWKIGNSIPAGLGSSHLLKSHEYHVWFILWYMLFCVCETSKLTLIYGLLWVKNLHFWLLDLSVKTLYWHERFFYQNNGNVVKSRRFPLMIGLWHLRPYHMDHMDSELCRELLGRIKLKCKNELIKSASHGTPPWWVALSASNFSPDCVRAPVIQATYKY